MARIYRDDITGEEVEDEKRLQEFGIRAFNESAPKETFDVKSETVLNDPDAVAEKMHELVDEWLEHYKEQTIENRGLPYTECHSCGYKWEYSGNKDMATCPDCANKTPVK